MYSIEFLELMKLLRFVLMSHSINVSYNKFECTMECTLQLHSVKHENIPRTMVSENPSVTLNLFKPMF